MAIPAPKFLSAVQQSGLVEKARLDEVLAVLERESGADTLQDTLAVSARLTQVGLLTNWQRERLLEGRHRGFFVGKYKLLNHLGSGGMSSVYLAQHIVMRRLVAIKILPTHRTKDSSFLARFHREARAAAALDHPNIVRAFDVDHQGDVHYLVMEYVEGRDLRETVEKDGPLDFRTAADYIRQACLGLAHAHEAGLIHRDMKPANLLIDRKRSVKVLDLGLARFSDDTEASLTKEFDEKVLGTVDYMAPEQALDSHGVDSRADIYSLGGTLYFLLTGHPPFPEGALAQRLMLHQTREPKDLREIRPDMPAELAAICRKMMAKKPAWRYQSAAEAGRALSEWLSQQTEKSADKDRPRPKSGGEEWRFAPLEGEQAQCKPAAVSQSRPKRATPSATQPPATRATQKPPSANKPSDVSKPEMRSSSDKSRSDLLAALPPLALPSALDNALAARAPKVADGKRRSQAKSQPSSSPWIAIIIGSLLGAAAAGSWLLFRLLMP